MSGLDMENSAPNFPEEQLQEMFPESNGDTGCERFDPASCSSTITQPPLMTSRQASST